MSQTNKHPDKFNAYYIGTEFPDYVGQRVEVLRNRNNRTYNIRFADEDFWYDNMQYTDWQITNPEKIRNASYKIDAITKTITLFLKHLCRPYQKNILKGRVSVYELDYKICVHINHRFTLITLIHMGYKVVLDYNEKIILLLFNRPFMLTP